MARCVMVSSRVYVPQHPSFLIITVIRLAQEIGRGGLSNATERRSTQCAASEAFYFSNYLNYYMTGIEVRAACKTRAKLLPAYPSQRERRWSKATFSHQSYHGSASSWKRSSLRKQRAKLAAGLDEVCSLQAEVAGLERVAAEVQQLKAQRATLEERAAALQTTAARVAAAERRLSHLPALQSRVALLRARHRLQARLKWWVSLYAPFRVWLLREGGQSSRIHSMCLCDKFSETALLSRDNHVPPCLPLPKQHTSLSPAVLPVLLIEPSCFLFYLVTSQGRAGAACRNITARYEALKAQRAQLQQLQQDAEGIQHQVNQAAGATRAASARTAAVSSTAAQVPLTATVAGSACQDAAAAASVVGTGAGIAMPEQAAKLGSAQPRLAEAKAEPAASLTAAPQPSTATACLAASAAALGSAHYAAKPGVAKPASQPRPLDDATALPASQTVAQPAAQPVSNPPGSTATPGCHMGGQGRDEAPLSLSHQSYQSLTFDTPAGGSHLFGWGVDKEAYFTPMAMAFTPGPEAAAFAAALKAGMAVPGKSSCSGGTDLAHASRDQDYDNSQAQSRAQPLELDPVCR
ncbi:hypothetical protein HaLaN_01078 [Haematococcus lacustris]|uniref:Uncharacterized protein n=1 Tax=Haematococcus lacustris TaxID=44745 RepID=A0A699Y8E5_HAELA|nr:hypothetical protein HaLaN_01078 [Haematococcus lacustris]